MEDGKLSRWPMIAITVLRVAGRVALPLRGHREADVAVVVGRGLPEAGARAVRRAVQVAGERSRTCSPTRTSSRCGGSRWSGSC